MNSVGKNENAAIIMQKRPLPNLNTGYWISLSYYTSWDSRKPETVPMRCREKVRPAVTDKLTSVRRCVTNE